MALAQDTYTQEELLELARFVRGHRDKAWILRSLQGRGIPGTNESVRTSTYSADGKHWVVPTIREIEGEIRHLDREGEDPWKIAQKKGDAIPFDTLEEAESFSRGYSTLLGKLHQRAPAPEEPKAAVPEEAEEATTAEQALVSAKEYYPRMERQAAEREAAKPRYGQRGWEAREATGADRLRPGSGARWGPDGGQRGGIGPRLPGSWGAEAQEPTAETSVALGTYEERRAQSWLEEFSSDKTAYYRKWMTDNHKRVLTPEEAKEQLTRDQAREVLAAGVASHVDKLKKRLAEPDALEQYGADMIRFWERRIIRNTPVGFREAFKRNQLGEERYFGFAIPFISTGAEGVGYWDLAQAAKADSSGTATPEQTRMLEDIADWQYRHRDPGLAVMGTIAGEGPAFAIEFWATGGLFKGLSKVGVSVAGQKLVAASLKKYSALRIGAKALKLAAGPAVIGAAANSGKVRSMLELSGKALAVGARQSVGQFAIGEALGGLTGGMSRVRAQAGAAMLQSNFQISTDEALEIQTLMVNDRTLAEAMPEILLNYYIENFTEAMGPALRELAPALNFAALKRFSQKVGWKKAKERLAKVGFDGIVEEMGEEFLGGILRAGAYEAAPEKFEGLAGSMDQFKDWRDVLGMAGGFALMAGGGYAASQGIQGAFRPGEEGLEEGQIKTRIEATGALREAAQEALPEGAAIPRPSETEGVEAVTESALLNLRTGEVQFSEAREATGEEITPELQAIIDKGAAEGLDVIPVLGMEREGEVRVMGPEGEAQTVKKTMLVPAKHIRPGVIAVNADMAAYFSGPGINSSQSLAAYTIHERVHDVLSRMDEAFRNRFLDAMRAVNPDKFEATRVAYNILRKKHGMPPLSAEEYGRGAEEAAALTSQFLVPYLETIRETGDTAALEKLLEGADLSLVDQLLDMVIKLVNKLPGLNIDPRAIRKLRKEVSRRAETKYDVATLSAAELEDRARWATQVARIFAVEAPLPERGEAPALEIGGESREISQRSLARVELQNKTREAKEAMDAAYEVYLDAAEEGEDIGGPAYGAYLRAQATHKRARAAELRAQFEAMGKSEEYIESAIVKAELDEAHIRKPFDVWGHEYEAPAPEVAPTVEAEAPAAEPAETGKPFGLTMLHGSPNPDLTELALASPAVSGRGRMDEGMGVWLTTSREDILDNGYVGEAGQIYQAEVRLDNPLVVDDRGIGFTDGDRASFIQDAIEGGHDGAVFRHEDGTIEVAYLGERLSVEPLAPPAVEPTVAPTPAATRPLAEARREAIARLRELKDEGRYDGKLTGTTEYLLGEVQRVDAETGEAVAEPVEEARVEEEGPAPIEPIVEEPLSAEEQDEASRAAREKLTPEENKEVDDVLGPEEPTGSARDELTPEQQKEYDDLDLFALAGGRGIERVPAWQQAVKDFKAGRITREEWLRIQDEVRPLLPYERVPRLYSDDELRRALKGPQKQSVGAEIADGTAVLARLDIPAYKVHGVWAPALHLTKGRPAIAFHSAFILRSPVFEQSKKQEDWAYAIAIKEGRKEGRKQPDVGLVRGSWQNVTAEVAHATATEAMGHANWVQVGFNPERHSYFFDRKNRLPVKSAEVAVQVGPLILAKNPVYTYERLPERTAPGAMFALSSGQVIAAQATKDFTSGKITWMERQRILQEHTPLRVYSEPPTLATIEAIRGALRPKGKPSAGQGPNIEEGHPVGIRVDLVTDAKKPPVGTVAVHDARGKSVGAKGTVLAYEPIAVIRDVRFVAAGPTTTAKKIAEGETQKSAFVVANGNWVPVTPEVGRALAEDAMTDASWRLVSYDPRRHNYFFDVETEEQVVSADAAIQIGKFMIAMNVVRTEGPSPEQRGGERFALAGSVDSAEFRAWFGDSKVVSDDGQPLVVYHGTRPPDKRMGREYTTIFDTLRGAATRVQGAYFTPDPSYAARYAKDVELGMGTISPVYLSLQNPARDTDLDRIGYLVDEPGESGVRMRNRLEAEGFDGVWSERMNELIAFSPTQVKSAIGNVGAYGQRPPTAEEAGRAGMTEAEALEAQREGDTRFALSPGTPPYTSTRRSRLRQRISPGEYRAEPHTLGSVAQEISERMADRHLPILQFIEMVKERGGVLNDTTDTYGLITRMSGIIEDLVKLVRRDFEDPIQELRRGIGMPQAELGTFTHARHADERNRYLVAQHEEYEEKQRVVDEMDEQIAAMTTAPPRVIQARTRKLDRLKREIAKYRKKAFRAGYDLERNAASGMPSTESYVDDRGKLHKSAKQILEELNETYDPAKLKEIGDLVDAMNRWSLRMRYEYVDDRGTLHKIGLISKDEYDEYSSRYKHYVPLRSDEADSEEGYTTPTRRSMQVRGREFERAFGRRTEAADPYVWSVMQAYTGIERAQRNVIGESFAQLLEDNPDLAWAINEEGETLRQFEMRVREEADVEIPDDSYTFKRKGKEFVVTLDEHLAGALKALNVENIPRVLRFVIPAMRWLRWSATGGNIDFMLPNFVRDLGAGLINLSVQDAKGLRSAVLKLTLSGRPQRAVWQHMNNVDPASLPPKQREMLEAIIRHAAAGGKSGWHYTKSFEDLRAGILDRAGEPQTVWAKVATRAKLRQVGELLERMNLSVENGVRAATFYELTKRGYSEHQAAVVSKDLTVNFNRMGRYGPAMNTLFMFYNAGAGGLLTMKRAIIDGDPESRARVGRMLRGLIVIGFIQEIYNRMMGDDDETGIPLIDGIPEWKQETNLVLLNPFGGVDVTVPLGYGYNAFHRIGRGLARVMFYGFSPVSETYKTLRVGVESANPMGSSPTLLHFISPTLFKPIVDIATNVNFAGNPVHPYQRGFGPQPVQSSESFTNTGGAFKWIAESMNSVTGGDYYDPGLADIYPDSLEHLFEFGIGGTGRTIERGLKSAKQLLTGEIPGIDDIPVVRRFLTAAPEWLLQSDYYDAVRDIELQLKRVKHYESIGRRDYVLELRKEVGPLLRLDGVLKGSRKKVKELRAALISAQQTENRPLQTKVENRLAMEYKRLLRRYTSALGTN